jgi:putative transposase
MNHDTKIPRPIRKQLDHSIHFHGRFGATFFITVCCDARRRNQLCKNEIANVLFDTARRYHDSQRWYMILLLLMPDHLHMLVGVPGDAQLSKLVRDFKRFTARVTKIAWQRNFFDHRLRHDESRAEKFEYILSNPIRAGLVEAEEHWPFVFVGETPSRRAVR